MSKKLDAVVVRMSDARDVNFGKSEKIKKVILWDADSVPTGIRFDGRNGKTLTVKLFDFPVATQVHAMAHGFSQKLGDEYCDIEAVDDCWETLIELHERLLTGAWKAEREGFAGISLLLTACVKVFGKTEDETRAILKGLSAKEKQALKLSPEVHKCIEAIETERAKGTDLTETMKKFG